MPEHDPAAAGRLRDRVVDLISAALEALLSSASVVDESRDATRFFATAPSMPLTLATSDVKRRHPSSSSALAPRHVRDMSLTWELPAE